MFERTICSLRINFEVFWLMSVRRDVRVVEGARLESVYIPKGYRGFESLSLRKA